MRTVRRALEEYRRQSWTRIRGPQMRGITREVSARSMSSYEEFLRTRIMAIRKRPTYRANFEHTV